LCRAVRFAVGPDDPASAFWYLPPPRRKTHAPLRSLSHAQPDRDVSSRDDAHGFFPSQFYSCPAVDASFDAPDPHALVIVIPAQPILSRYPPSGGLAKTSMNFWVLADRTSRFQIIKQPRYSLGTKGRSDYSDDPAMGFCPLSGFHPAASGPCRVFTPHGSYPLVGLSIVARDASLEKPGHRDFEGALQRIQGAAGLPVRWCFQSDRRTCMRFRTGRERL